MKCPFCGNEDTQVKDSRSTEDNSACCSPTMETETVVAAKPKIKMSELSNSNSCDPKSGCC